MVTYVLFTITSWLVPYIPTRIGYKLAELVAWLAYFILPKPRNGIKGNLRQALGPDLDESEITRLAHQCFESAAKNYYDLFRIPILSLDDLENTVRVDGWDILQEALAEGKGAIVFSAHLGNLELISQIIVARDMKAVIPVEHIRPEKLFKLVTDARSSRGLKLVPTDGGALREIYRALKQNCIVGMGADRAVQGTGIWTEFFGRETVMPDAPAVLVLRTGAKALPVLGTRQPDNSFVVKIHPPLDLVNTGNAHRDARVNTNKVIKIMEGFIRDNPGQWVVFEPMWQDGTKYAKRAKERARSTAN